MGTASSDLQEGQHPQCPAKGLKAVHFDRLNSWRNR